MLKMKKEVIILAIISILLISISIGMISAKDAKKDKIEQKVLDKVSKDGKVRVIVKLKDSNKSERGKIMYNAEKKVKSDKIKREFSSINAFSAELDAKEISELESDANVESIYYDRLLSVDLQDSVPLINATKAWDLQAAGINLTGKGQTICVIDTGVDYTHPDLGNCTPVKLALNGSNESYILESAHPYTNDYDYTWAITKPGYSQIALHFVNISMEYPGQGGWDSADRIIIYNSQGKEIARYHGINGVITNLWTPSSNGSTIYVRLVTDVSVTNYGFYVDQVLNGTTNTTYDWGNCSKIIAGWDFVNNEGDPRDDQGHGTHVTGIAAANGAIKGVAPEAKIVAAKALDASGDGYSSDTIAGIEWCTNRSEELNISVISMSLGTDCGNPEDCYNMSCDSADSLTAAAINNANAKNISVVVASGNEASTSLISFPACIEKAIPVGATTKGDAMASYTNRNMLLQILAPGSSINSTCNGGDYCTKSGTSMATPHVAGAIAIINQFLKLQGDSRNPQEIESALNMTGKIIYDSGSGLNYSRINVYGAIMALDTISPVVNLISPSNDYSNNSAGSLNITFKCNATDFIMKNLTFYLWNETSIYNNSYKSISGANGEFEVNIANLRQGEYAWNCLAYDNSSNSAFASSNYSLAYDIEAPNITLSNPNDGYSTTSTANSFDFYVDDDISIASCCLIINNALAQCNTSAIVKGSLNSISYDLAVGEYSWSINCTDNAGNSANSNITLSGSRTIKISSPPSTSRGGGGGGASYSTFSADEGQMLSGYQKELEKGDIIKFNINNQAHNLKVDYIGENSVNLTVRSSPISLLVLTGEEKKLNLSSSDYYDFSVRLNSISEAGADITIKEIYELILSREEEKPEAPISAAATQQTAEPAKNDRILAISNEPQEKGYSKTEAFLVILGLTISAVILFAIITFLKQYLRQQSLRKKVKIRR